MKLPNRMAKIILPRFTPIQIDHGRVADRISWHQPHHAEYLEYKQKHSDIFFRVKSGDIFKNRGDILLCPVSENFVFSNPLSQKLAKREKQIMPWVKKIRLNSDRDFKTEHSLFLPLRNLKYRGVLLVAMDFYSKNKDQVNAERVAESFSLLKRYNCCKLSMPHNILYEKAYEEFYVERNMLSMARILSIYQESIDFVVELVLAPSLNVNAARKYYYINEYVTIPERCPYVRKLYRHMQAREDYPYPEEYFYSRGISKKLLKVLTGINPDSNLVRLVISTLREKIGRAYETAPDRGNLGFKKELEYILNELPWNREFISSQIAD